MTTSPHTTTTSQRQWKWPIPLDRYDRASSLSASELEALSVLVNRRSPRRRGTWPAAVETALHRLLWPLQDTLDYLGIPRNKHGVVMRVLIIEMQRRQTSFWAWSDSEWVETIALTRDTFVKQNSRSSAVLGRSEVLAIAYLLCGFSSLFLFPKRRVHRHTLARNVFGKEALNHADQRVYAVVQGWGYAQRSSAWSELDNTLCTALLLNHSPYLEDLTVESLLALRNQVESERMGGFINLLSRVLVELRIIDVAFPMGNQPIPVKLRCDTEGIAPTWVEWCFRWHTTATGLAPETRDKYLSNLLKVGRWLALHHPEITTPGQWTYTLAAEWVAQVDSLRIGEFCEETTYQTSRGLVGKPQGPRSKHHHLAVMRAFFKDVQEEPYNVPRAFDPNRAFRTPRAIQRLIGPSPRDIDPLIWARLVHAAVHLTEEDLPRSPSQSIQYPLLLVRAIAVTWCYSALRSDEIRRLPVGCIRWQREDMTIPETGEILPKDAVCFLTVPVNKTNTSFPKAVNPLVGQVINEWERVRPAQQPLVVDRKTGELIQVLFAHRGHGLSMHYLNKTLIPLLCKKAGIPRADERGAITSHRARATIATLLYNAPEGLTIWELMQWLGHQNPASTRHYARTNPTKLAQAYSKADRNSRLVEALVDTKADANGEVKIYYVLGDHGFCSNSEWASCLYRMACVKCPFFVPKEQGQLIQAQKSVRRFMEVVELTDEEVAAAQDDEEKIRANVERTERLPKPTLLRQHPKGESHSFIPLTVIHDVPHPA